MQFFLNPYGAPGVVALFAGWTMAWLVYSAGPRRPQNRRLSLLLVLEASWAGIGGGIMYLAANAQEAFSWQIVSWALVPFWCAAYLSFVALLDTPLTRPFRPVLVRASLLALALLGSWYIVLHPEVFFSGTVQLSTGDHEAVPTPLAGMVFLAMTAVYLYGLVAALHAFLRAPKGTATRRKARLFAIAFGIKDASLTVLLVLFAALADPVALHLLSVLLGQTTLILFVGLLGYALLREQVLDIELKLKWTISRGTLAAIFFAAFFIATETAQTFLGETIGSAYIGTLAVGCLLFLLAPLQRLTDRLADRALPGVQQSEEYLRGRRIEIYRAAFESALLDGQVTERERDVLATLAEELGMGPAEARSVERLAVARK